jgi:hypothetical protein
MCVRPTVLHQKSARLDINDVRVQIIPWRTSSHDQSDHTSSAVIQHVALCTLSDAESI